MDSVKYGQRVEIVGGMSCYIGCKGTVKLALNHSGTRASVVIDAPYWAEVEVKASNLKAV